MQCSRAGVEVRESIYNVMQGGAPLPGAGEAQTVAPSWCWQQQTRVKTPDKRASLGTISCPAPTEPLSSWSGCARAGKSPGQEEGWIRSPSPQPHATAFPATVPLFPVFSSLLHAGSGCGIRAWDLGHGVKAGARPESPTRPPHPPSRSHTAGQPRACCRLGTGGGTRQLPARASLEPPTTAIPPQPSSPSSWLRFSCSSRYRGSW